jgi:hypothetical protein
MSQSAALKEELCAPRVALPDRTFKERSGPKPTRGHLIGEGPLQIAIDAAVLGAAADSRAGRATVFALTCMRWSRRQFCGLICGSSLIYFFYYLLLNEIVVMGADEEGDTRTAEGASRAVR